MKLNAQTENARTLAAALGIGEKEAAELLSATVAITYDERDDVSAQFAKHVDRLISRTIRSVLLNQLGKQEGVGVELVIGNAEPRFSAPCLFAAIGQQEVTIGPVRGHAQKADIHPIGLLLGACYAVGAILRKAFKDLLPFPSPEILKINLVELLGDDLPLLYEVATFDEAYLAGAGAIGNGFIYGLSQFQVRGVLHVADDDLVSDGNLQRCVFFTEGDIDLRKAERLCDTMRVILPGIEAVPHNVRLQDVPGRKSGAWLERLIVAVDSPRARRNLQSEIPGEVYDASTTGISEVVLHFNRQPTDLACMSCVYYESPEEHAHEKHVATALGVAVEDVKCARISESAAATICGRYPQLDRSSLVGLAYDTMFKQLCSTGQLTTPEGRQVLAPFAFVAVLAGALLAVEFVRRLHNGSADLFNLWHVSPWTNPVLRCRKVLGTNPECEFCGNQTLVRVAREMWQEAQERNTVPTEAVES
jgi:hypothetical protein